MNLIEALLSTSPILIGLVLITYFKDPRYTYTKVKIDDATMHISYSKELKEVRLHKLFIDGYRIRDKDRLDSVHAALKENLLNQLKSEEGN